VPPPTRRARRRLLLVHAHPDDETITTGGTIAHYAAAPDTDVTLVTCTLGEQGEVMVPALAGLVAERADQLGGYRIAELARACEALGLTDQRFLGGPGRWRDSGMVVTEGVHAAAPPPERLHPAAFTQEQQRADQIDALAAIMDEVRPQVVVGYDPRGGYGHPDHVRAHEITMEAAQLTPSVRKVYWTVDARSEVVAGLDRLAEARGNGLPWRLASLDELPNVPDEKITTRVDVRGRLAAKVAALRAHATQLTVWQADGRTAFALTNEIAQPVLPVESYILVGGPDAEATGRGHGETDLFEGISP
jgi:N-acetyl-1-D-myo-inositol-2-amino-2-deoxy-alpha-D-glucopyranoside deacetylase